MPYRVAKHMCNEPLCDKVITAGRYCEEHKNIHDAIGSVMPDKYEQNKAYDSTRPSAPKRGYNREWRSIRDRVIHDNPICQICFEKHSTCVHHVPDYVVGTDHGQYELIACCHGCHETTKRKGKRLDE